MSRYPPRVETAKARHQEIADQGLRRTTGRGDLQSGNAVFRIEVGGGVLSVGNKIGNRRLSGPAATPNSRERYYDRPLAPRRTGRTATATSGEAMDVATSDINKEPVPKYKNCSQFRKISNSIVEHLNERVQSRELKLWNGSVPGSIVTIQNNGCASELAPYRNDGNSSPAWVSTTRLALETLSAQPGRSASLVSIEGRLSFPG
ncbi:MAG: hypothetical protein CM1200mP20_14660 [Pseudomonadota bacterium]|nr:MAG: hypothetical protein CM1200mP20_14660 [Pseudomonadota bacterium]